MPELSIPYELVGPDGTRVVFGNADAARSDPDYVGWLDPDSGGITGLLDAGAVRVSTDDRVEGDGAFHGPFWRGRRTGTVNLFITPDPEPSNGRVAKVKRACRALREDAFLRWTPSDETIQRELRVRREEPPRESNRRPKQMQVALSSADHRIFSTTEASVTIIPGGGVGELGYGDPYGDPYGTTSNVAGQVFVTNAGDETTPPRFRVDGPISNPRLRNHTLGLETRFNITLAANEYLTIDTRVPTVLLNGAADIYDAYDFTSSEWWELAPGQNDIRLLATSYDTGAALTVYYRHAWE